MKKILLPRLAVNLSGKKFSRLTALYPVDDGVARKSRSVLWLCECECGTRKPIRGLSLKQGTTVSCGCLKIERGRQRGADSSTHGMSGTLEWRAWSKMKARCFDKKSPQYADWGGRGITVCARWIYSFENFLADVGLCPPEKYSIDRIENDGNYEPGNVRWATRSEQMRNKRTNRIISAFGKTQPLVCFVGDSKSLQYRRARQRIVIYGWHPERAVMMAWLGR